MKNRFYIEKTGSVLVYAVIAFLIFMSICLPSVSADSDLSPPEHYFEEGVAQYKAGDYAHAIENFRKVLFVQMQNYRASWYLIESLEKLGKYKKAKKECKYFADIVERSTTLSEEQKKEFLTGIKEKEALYTQLRVNNRTEYEGELTKVDMAFIIYALLLICFFLIKSVFSFQQKLIEHKKEEEEKKLWVDPYWERQKEEELSSFSMSVTKGIFYLLSLIIVICAIRIMILHGLTKTFTSIFRILD